MCVMRFIEIRQCLTPSHTGVAYIAEGLGPNLGLYYLGLAWCGMQDAGAQAFGTMLENNEVRLDPFRV